MILNNVFDFHSNFLTRLLYIYQFRYEINFGNNISIYTHIEKYNMCAHNHLNNILVVKK